MFLYAMRYDTQTTSLASIQYNMLRCGTLQKCKSKTLLLLFRKEDAAVIHNQYVCVVQQTWCLFENKLDDHIALVQNLTCDAVQQDTVSMSHHMRYDSHAQKCMTIRCSTIILESRRYATIVDVEVYCQERHKVMLSLPKYHLAAGSHNHKTNVIL